MKALCKFIFYFKGTTVAQPQQPPPPPTTETNGVQKPKSNNEHLRKVSPPAVAPRPKPNTVSVFEFVPYDTKFWRGKFWRIERDSNFLVQTFPLENLASYAMYKWLNVVVRVDLENILYTYLYKFILW